MVTRGNRISGHRGQQSGTLRHSKVKVPLSATACQLWWRESDAAPRRGLGWRAGRPVSLLSLNPGGYGWRCTKLRGRVRSGWHGVTFT